MTLGEWLRDLRESRQMSLGDVSKASFGHLKKQYVKALEHDEISTPDLRKVHRLAGLYGVPVSEMIRRVYGIDLDDEDGQPPEARLCAVLVKLGWDEGDARRTARWLVDMRRGSEEVAAESFRLANEPIAAIG